MSGAGAPDERRFNEKLDDLQALHPFLYNVAVGAVVGLVLLLFGFHLVLGAAYALSYATLRWFLWQDGRVLRRQYDARKVRSDAESATRRGGA